MIDGLLLSLGIVIFYAGLDRLIIHLNRRSPKVLMYHACDRIENEFIRGLSINTPPDRLAAHLDYLLSRYRVVFPGRTSEDDPHRANSSEVTFDDGFRSVPRQRMAPSSYERQVPRNLLPDYARHRQ